MARIIEDCQVEVSVVQGNGGYYTYPKCPLEIGGVCRRSGLPLGEARDRLQANPTSKADAEKDAPGNKAGIRVVCRMRRGIK